MADSATIEELGPADPTVVVTAVKTRPPSTTRAPTRTEVVPADQSRRQTNLPLARSKARSVPPGVTVSPTQSIAGRQVGRCFRPTQPALGDTASVEELDAERGTVRAT